MQKPWIIASDGLRESWIACSTSSSSPSYSETAVRLARIASNSEMPAPAENAAVPAPRNATQRTSPSASNCFIAGAMPRHMASLMAFFFAGWSNTIQPTEPRFETPSVTLESRLARRTVDRRDRAARVAPRPPTRVDLRQELLEQLVE